MQQITTCPICGNTNFEDHYTCQDFTVSHETFKIVKCNCGLAITTPRPNEGDLGNYYLSDDYISHSNKAKTIIDRLYLIARRYTLNQKLNLISKYNPISSILDYGCGTGYFLNICKSNGWNIFGVEPSLPAREKAIALTKGHIYSSIEDIKEEKIDVITLWHVLEHIPDPNAILQNLSSHLTTNGTIIIAVPNYEAYDAETYKDRWAGYDTPRHLWHFTKSSLEKLLNRNSLKLKSVVPMKLDAFYVSLLSEKYKRHGINSIKGYFAGFMMGMKSNLKASKSGNYSSLIYVVQK